MNEKDSKAIHELFSEFHSSDNLGLLKSKLVNYVTAVRQEERRAALERHAGAVCGFCERGNPVQFIAARNCFKHQLEGETPWTTCRANDMRMVERALESAR